MKVLLIYNPYAGHKTFANSLDYVIERFVNIECDLIPYRISEKSNLEKRIEDIKEDEFEKIIIAGGDGTIHLVVNLLIKNNIDIPLGIFPIGTANDFARYFEIPKNIEAMVDIVMENNYILCDVGLANDNYFINVASIGFAIDISQKTNTDVKNNIGLFAYYIKAIEELHNIKAVEVNVTSDEMNFKGEVYFMLIMNGKSAGGFTKISPYGSMSDGLLDVFIFKKAPLIDILPLIIQIMNGEHVKSNHVEYFQTKELKVECNENTGTDLDGEKGVEFPMLIKAIPNKIKINVK